MTNVLGSGRSEVLTATTKADHFMAGEGRADTMHGNSGADTMLGGGGDDTMAGNGGHDTMFGATTMRGAVDMTKFQIAESGKGSVTFDFEEAGFKNTLGMYKIAADGRIYDVQILFANASLKGSGGELVSGKSGVSFDLAAGDRLGFFIVPDAFSKGGMSKLLSDKQGTFQFVDAKGNPGEVDGGAPLKLQHVDRSGKTTDIVGQYGTDVFHSVDNGKLGLNPDKMNHVVGQVDVSTGTVKIGFEDIKHGGDRDFDDSVFTLNIGTTNSALLAKVATKPLASSDADVMHGGDGHDTMFGMRDDDQMWGGEGNDRMWGNSGNDTMDGGDGNDLVSGGKGDDVLAGGDGNDEIKGDSGDDKVLADGGNDTLDGGSGFDTLDFSVAAAAAAIDLHAGLASGAATGRDTLKGFEGAVGTAFDDVIKGNKSDNVLDGGAGNDEIRGLQGADVLTGGDGEDTFVFFKADVLRNGVHQGVDRVTDFGRGDKLDISNLLNGQKWSSIGDVVEIKDDGQNSQVHVRFHGGFHQVAVLDGVTGQTASDLLTDGMLLT